MNGPKCGFVSQRKMTTVLLYVGKMITGGNASSMLKYLSSNKGLNTRNAVYLTQHLTDTASLQSCMFVIVGKHTVIITLIM